MKLKLQPDPNIPEPILFIVSECNTDAIINPLTDNPMTKSEMGLIVCFIDMLVVVLILVLSSLLEHSQKAYTAKFKEQTLQMSDFSIRVKNLPRDIKFKGKNHILKAYLTEHFESVANEQRIKNGMSHDDIDTKVAHINFGLSELVSTNYLEKLS